MKEVTLEAAMWTSPRDEIILEFSNITSWSHWAANRVGCAEADAVAIAEHHQPLAKLGQASFKMYSEGWRPIWSPAVQSRTSEAGTYGGTGWLVKSHLQARPLARAESLAFGWVDDTSFAYSTACQLRWSGAEILLLSG